MNRTIRFFCLAVLCLTGLGCSYPSTKVTRGEDRPALFVVGAPATATLEVDGINHGLAEQYDGQPTTLLVEPGTHKVRIVDGNTILLSKDIYVSNGETRSLTLKRD